MQTADSNAFQLIIVDNKSTDNTVSIAKRFIESNPGLNIKYVLETNKGLSFARNRGIKEADAPIIAYVDDDAILPPTYLEAMLKFFSAYPQTIGVGVK
jgi:glycosyltransferase involved in cell wall biosynthesis